MRSRNLKPGFFSNDKLAEVDPLGRILFAGLWCVADRKGRLEDRPKRLKAELLPYDAANVDELLDDLQRQGFIDRYEAGGERYIQVLNFAKHQNPHLKEAASTIPPHGESNASNVQTPCESGADTVREQDKPGASTIQASEIPERAGLIPDSLLLIPDSKKPAKSPKGDWVGFDDFYSAYPKHEAKADALKAWNSLRPDELIRARIKKSIAAAKQTDGWIKDRGAYIPLPASWLRKRRWEDELPINAVALQSEKILTEFT